MFEPVGASVSFPELEAQILEFWRQRAIVSRALAEKQDRPRFVFYEGPPTANNKPGLHHVWARVFKDIYCRYKTMQGYFVPRKAGWDCHGLPVELEIEKELGIDSKPEIEEYGIDRFNARCRESVQRYVKDWERLTERIGFWLDMASAYWTMSNEYIQSVWWQLGQMWKKGLVYKDAKVVPYCPRCGTALSSHEVAQGYQETTDPSVYVRFPVIGDAEPRKSLLIWTTTPWTLVSNVAVAAHPDAEYVEVRVGDEVFVLAEPRLEAVFGPDADVEILKRSKGSELDYRYRRPFEYIDADRSERAYSVVSDAFVTMDEGTGLVHIAPAFGEVDREVGRRWGLGSPNPVDDRGRFDSSVGRHAGKPVREANAALIEELREAGLLFKAEDYVHSYPHCWRCNTALIYWAKPTWYIRTTEYKDLMLAENASIDWHPEHIKEGRFGDWLANNVDWSLSRDRYWGTPLPIWTCRRGHYTFAESVSELEKLVGHSLDTLDLHRPYVDELVFRCPQCPEDDPSEARREPPVLDAWFDSGAMPAAQFGYPFVPNSVELFEANFPADFIAEGIDQTRGWFYSLLAVSALVFGKTSYKSVLCLGHIVDAEGRKMSKRLGNVIDPWTILDSLGADALRWYFFSSGSPWVSNRVSLEAIEKSTSQFLLTYWNTYSFLVTYANADAFDPRSSAPPLSERPLLDRWITSRLAETIDEVTNALDSYDALAGARSLDSFVRDLSNWYVRRSRRRFWSARSEVSEPDKEAAYRTLYDCVATLSLLIAPYCPFVAEAVYQNLVASKGLGAESVHLASWPARMPEARDPGLEERVAVVRKLVSLGRAARTSARIRVRQPLATALLAAPTDPAAIEPELIESLEEELNVDEVRWVDLSEISQLRISRLKPNFKTVGPKLGKDTQKLPSVLDAQDASEIIARLETTGTIELEIDGSSYRLDKDDLIVETEDSPGYSVAVDGPYGIALDTRLSPELELRGLARELTHRIQNLRKEAGLEVTDRIELWLEADGRLGDAIREHKSYISAELLAVALTLGSPPDDVANRQDLMIDGEKVSVGLQKIRGS